MTSRGNDGTAALDKALDVLDAVGGAACGLSQADLGQRLGLPRTTLYRLLGTLVARGLLRRDPMRRVYCLGSRYSHAQRSQAAVGERKPLHCTSQGKAILAAMPPQRRDAMVRDITLTAFTPRTLTDRRRLHAELKLIAQRGWSIDDEEVAPGVRCCGAPIVDGHGEVRGAISVAGPAFRLTTERIELLGPELAEAARRIGAQLAFARPARSDCEAQVVPGEWAFEGAFAQWLDAPLAGGARLWWADRLAPALHVASAAADQMVAGFDHPIQALLPVRDAVRVLAGEAWHLYGADGRRRDDAGQHDSLPRVGVLSACPGAMGQNWICLPDGQRWRVATLNAHGQANGGWQLNEPATALAWSETQRTLHIAAAGSGTLYAAPVGQSGLLRLATVPKGSGRLGGLAVDNDGGLWTALRGGWSVARFEPDGSMDRVVALPVPAPTGVAFGGEHGRTLFVTTARDALDRESLDAAPLLGRLFVVSGG